MVTLIGRSSHIQHGTEGPKHDPYGWTEYTMWVTYQDEHGQVMNWTFTLHEGIIDWLSVNHRRERVVNARRAWELLTRVELDRFRKLYETRLHPYESDPMTTSFGGMRSIA